MDGTAWYRTTCQLSNADLGKPVHLGLGTIDDSDITWVNGVEVGRTTLAYNRPRVYDVPASALHAGDNVITIRAEDTGGGGGLYGDSTLRFLDVGGDRRALPPRWKFRVGTVTIAPDPQHINRIPAVAYHIIVHPILRYPITGAIWYQGESNTDPKDAVAYRTQFADLIRSWRRDWTASSANFPFLWVQLANYMAVDSVPPVQSGWALLRESQTATLDLPRTAQAVIIDIGETNDIHPRNKLDVGHRLALGARAIAYGERIDYVSPTFRSQAVRDGRVTIELSHARGLRTRDGKAPGGFAIAGADRRFVWANARIEGERVIVWSDRVAAPVAVRYAWGDNPLAANLVNADGLPATPFRTGR